MSLPYHHQGHRPSSLIIPIATESATLFIIVLLILLCHRLSRSRIAPAKLIKSTTRRFSYSQRLCLTIECFSPTNKLVYGGFGSIYRDQLPGSIYCGQLPGSGHLIAVKLMDSGLFQGKHEFQNKLTLPALTARCDCIVSLLGFSSDRCRCLLLVYELMPNRSLQDALLDRRLQELMPWSQQFSVA